MENEILLLGVESVLTKERSKKLNTVRLYQKFPWLYYAFIFDATFIHSTGDKILHGLQIT